MATAGQTIFPAVYGEFVEVHVNGLLLASTDYTATDGVQELQIASYTRLIVAGQKTIDDVPDALKVEVQYRVDHWFD